MWTKTERISKEKPVNNGLNPWSHGKTIKVYVSDWGFDFREIKYKGKTMRVEYALFQMLVKQMMKCYDATKEEVLDELFDIKYMKL
jgi:hypothetical protein